MVRARHDKEVCRMPKTHYFPEDQVHYLWDNELEPVLTVEPGDTVVYRTREVSDGQIGPDSTVDVLDGLDWDSLYPLAGPVAMTNAEPGDILTVEVLDMHTEAWGWTAVLPGFGLLPEDFPDAYLKIFDLTNGDYTLFKDDIAIPIEPFFGTMGVSPSGPEKPVVMPPGPFGGNMDTRHITKGSVLYLPVQHAGALFSCGDAHAAQGDGEVCVTGIESPMYAALRFDLIKGRSIPAPQFQTPGPLTPLVDEAGCERLIEGDGRAHKHDLRARARRGVRAGEPRGGPQDLRDRGPAELDRLFVLASGHLRVTGQDPLPS
jgi:acetamidase/formamidase